MPPSLILGSMPLDAQPETHIAAGPWCFAGQEGNFPDWETRFHFAPEPLANQKLLPCAAKAAQSLCVSMIPQIAATLCQNSEDFAKVYWQTLLCPWCIEVASQIIERGLRVGAMIEKWHNVNLIVPILKTEQNFVFKDEHDFTLNGSLGIIFNYWLFSRILENNWPDNWQKQEVSISNLNPIQKKLVNSLPKKFNDLIHEFLRAISLKLPFPRLKGMSMLQAIKFSAALLHTCHTSDHSLNLEKLFQNEPMPPGCLFPKNIKEIFLATLPESIKNLHHNKPAYQCRYQHIRIANIIAYENTVYRQQLAQWRQNGNRLAFAQHGCNYGQAKTICNTALFEYTQDVFFTWGWKTQGNECGNFIPMPYIQLNAIKDKWQGSNSDFLLFVGTEMAAYAYRLESRPSPLQFLNYRNAKADFFTELGFNLQSRSLYRPYFSFPGLLEDGSWLLQKFPLLKKCEGALLPSMLNCRLLILDHNGTTLLEAFAAGIPVILYWNRKMWQLTPEYEEVLSILEECGIWYQDAQSAAKKVREIWDHVPEWNNSPKIVHARKLYREQQALIYNGDIDKLWINTLKKL